MASACIYLECPVTGMILAVSRKDNIYDMGLPGGKVEEGESEKQAAIRELRQETGIALDNVWGGPVEDELEEIFRRDGGVTFGIRTVGFPGDVHKRAPGETGRVAWVYPDELLRGCFGDYNERLLKHIGKIK
jgi:8-oxo-dGTP pyrophosphatase MutT (NUDIX family)